MRCPIDHFSYSQLSTYLQCPLRYRLQYVELVAAAFTSSALVFGSCMHEALAGFHQQLLLGDHLRPDQMVDLYRQAWASRNGELVRYCNGDSEKSLLEKAGQMLNVYHECFDTSTEILGVEEFFELEVVSSVPPFRGYIDLIEKSSDGSVTVVDLKTAARKLPVGQAHTNLQPTAYSIGAGALGFEPDAIALRLDVITKTKTPDLSRHETTRTEQERDRFCKLVTNVWAAIEREIWFPRHDWHCQQCAWAEPCKKW
jgi:putative RecB family exonuclease